MPAWLHRTTKRQLRSVASADLPEAIANYIEEPDLSAVVGQPVKYWLITGDVVSLVDVATQLAIDAALLVATRDALANDIDRNESFMKAFALVVLDEFNNLRSQHGLSPRTIAQLKNAVRSKLDG